MKQRDEDLAREVEALKQRLEALEKQVKERGQFGISTSIKPILAHYTSYQLLLRTLEIKVRVQFMSIWIFFPEVVVLRSTLQNRNRGF